MKYGLPYKGSKNKLAERIVRLLPKRTHLIDLFCGGCAVSHAALLIKKYEHIHINDVNWMCPTLFTDALAGKYNNDTRWISREDFFRLKDSDPYVAVVWSFGNNMRNYLYSKEIEPLKKAIHYAMFFGDYSLGKELGHDLSFIDPIHDIQKRYIAVKRYFGRLGHFQQQSFEGGADASRTPYSELAAQPYTGGAKLLQTGNIRKAAQYLSEYHPLERSTGGYFKKNTSDPANATRRTRKQACIACNTESDSRAYHAIRGGQILPITSSVLDYTQVEIPKDSIIYCDIPYENTNVYNKGEGGFDYERFYQWAERRSEPVFISSYQMPADRFDCIMEFSHRSTLSASANNLVKERIFVPKHQAERERIYKEPSLFDFDNN